MCGIVGYIGDNPAAERVLEGLARLEYRGYDSAGVAYHAGDHHPIESRRRLRARRDCAHALGHPW
jgi:glutamine---fructose-6-phosphate transaminase (isomerizing)